MRTERSAPRGGLAPPGSSMALLQDLVEHAVDDDYYAVAQRPEDERAGRARMRWATITVLVLFALLVAVALVQTRIDQPAAESERAALIDQIGAQKHDVRSKQKKVASLRHEVTALRSRSTDESSRRRIRNQKVTTGAVPVTGPGVRTVVDNAEDSEGREGRVMDKDLQLLVNGLWLAGAEAISINGNRLTTLSSIRTAGEAITVNYKSLTRPYVVSAIGDPKTLQARFIETAGGQAWSNLHNNFGLRFDMTVKDDLSLPAPPRKRLRVRVAERMEETP